MTINPIEDKQPSKTLLKEIDRFAYLASIGFTIILTIAYFAIWEWRPPLDTILPIIREFALAIITNFIPVFLIFAASYALFRRIQTIKSEQESDELVNRIAGETRNALADELSNIQKRLGLSAKFVSDFPRQDATGEIYKSAIEIVEKAEKEIWVLWYNRPLPNDKISKAKRGGAYIGERERYYQTILRKCHKHKRSTLFYRRILQLSEPVQGNIIPSSALTESIAKHCREMLEFISEYPEAAVLKHSPTALEQTFFLVDERYILWELDAVDLETKQQYIEGLLIFEDSEKIFIRYLKDFFLKVDAHAIRVKGIVEDPSG